MLNAIKNISEDLQHKTIWVAYSGGLDSTVLLHLAKEYQDSRKDIDLRAVHINHNLSPNSQNWCDYAIKTCKKYDIPLTIKKISGKPKKTESIEAWARNQRYQSFEILAKKDQNCILLAHHQNDQAETFLLNALRGSGLSGLSAMPQVRESKGITYIRPLLSYSRKNIKDYATHNHLNWIEDESNASCKFNRNYLRHKVLPTLTSRWPKCSTQLAKTVQLCAESHTVLSQYIQQDLHNLLINKNDTSSLDFNRLIRFETIKIKLILKHWLNNIFNIQIPHNEYEIISQDLSKKETGWQYQLTDIYCLQRYRGKLSINEATNDVDVSFKYIWDTSISKELYIPELNQILSIKKLIEFGLGSDVVESSMFIIRSRLPQDRCLPAYRQKSQKLKIIYQELKIPQWDRKKSILIENLNTSELLAVYPYFLCKPINKPITQYL